MDTDRLLGIGLLVAFVLPVGGATLLWARSWRRRRTRRRAQAAAFAQSMEWTWTVAGPRLLARMGGPRGARRCEMVEIVAGTSQGDARTWTRWTSHGSGAPSPEAWRIEIRPRGVVTGAGLFLERVATGEADLDERLAIHASSPQIARALLGDAAVRRLLGALGWRAVVTGRLAGGGEAGRLLRLRGDGDLVSVEEPGVGHDEARWRRALDLLDALVSARAAARPASVE